MFHPLSADFSGLSDEQIAAKINQLYKVIRSSRNIDIHRQASMMLDELHDEQRRRAEKKLLEEMERTGTKFDDIIDIK